MATTPQTALPILGEVRTPDPLPHPDPTLPDDRVVAGQRPLLDPIKLHELDVDDPPWADPLWRLEQCDRLGVALGLHPTERLALSIIARHAGTGRRNPKRGDFKPYCCYLKRAELAELVGVTERQVQRSRAKLKALGVVKFKQGTHSAATYLATGFLIGREPVDNWPIKEARGDTHVSHRGDTHVSHHPNPNTNMKEELPPTPLTTSTVETPGNGVGVGVGVRGNEPSKVSDIPITAADQERARRAMIRTVLDELPSASVAIVAGEFTAYTLTKHRHWDGGVPTLRNSLETFCRKRGLGHAPTSSYRQRAAQAKEDVANSGGRCPDCLRPYRENGRKIDHAGCSGT